MEDMYKPSMDVYDTYIYIIYLYGWNLLDGSLSYL